MPKCIFAARPRIVVLTMRGPVIANAKMCIFARRPLIVAAYCRLRTYPDAPHLDRCVLHHTHTVSEHLPRRNRRYTAFVTAAPSRNGDGDGEMRWRWRNPQAAKGHKPNNTRRVERRMRKREVDERVTCQSARVFHTKTQEDRMTNVL